MPDDAYFAKMEAEADMRLAKQTLANIKQEVDDQMAEAGKMSANQAIAKIAKEAGDKIGVNIPLGGDDDKPFDVAAARGKLNPETGRFE